MPGSIQAIDVKCSIIEVHALCLQLSYAAVVCYIMLVSMMVSIVCTATSRLRCSRYTIVSHGDKAAQKENESQQQLHENF